MRIVLVLAVLLVTITNVAGCGDSGSTAADQYNHGMASYRKAQFDLAIRAFTKAIELDPKYITAYESRGLGYARSSQHDAAIRDFTRAIELDPQYSSAYYNRGSAYYEKAQFDAAIQDYSKVIELDPADSEAYYMRSYAYYKKGQYDQAITDANTCRALAKQLNDSEMSVHCEDALKAFGAE